VLADQIAGAAGPVRAQRAGPDGSDDATVASAVELSHKLGLAVVGEGAGTAAHLEALRRHGCDAAQGYWVCRPGPPGTITDWLAANRGEGPPWVPYSRATTAPTR
jgi:EAL domain-containing protein (putative c-di-GMP-specific phosphodiesterase class I)